MSKKIHCLVCLQMIVTLLLVVSPRLSAQQSKWPTLSVQVVDDKSGETLPGAVVMIGKQHAVMDENGKGKIKFPKGSKHELKAQMFGYKNYTKLIHRSDLSKGVVVIRLTLEIESLDNVTVVAEKPRTQSTTVAVKMSQARLQENVGKNLATVLSELPGLSSISTGSTIMKPVIQGMHSKRILLINNGVKQAGQEWGSDHAPEVDASSATDLEVIKGAESIRYGAGALGGVILLRSASLRASDEFGGSATLRGGTNAVQGGFNGDVYGSADFLPGFRYRAQLSGGAGGDYRTPEYALNNTGTRQMNGALALGMQGKKWKVETFASYFYDQLGIFYGAHIGNLSDLRERFETGRPAHLADPSFDIHNPKQQVQHVIGKALGQYDLGNAGLIKAQYDYQFDDRQEFERRRGNLAKLPALWLMLSTHAGRISWESPLDNDLRFILGASGSYQLNVANDKTRYVPIVPNYLAENVGSWLVAKYKQPIYELEAGVRYDYKYLYAIGFDRMARGYEEMRQYHSPTFSFSGVLRPVDGLSFYTNLGLAWRGPEVNELFCDGIHHGAGTYEIGDQNLKPEHGLKWNNEVLYRSQYVDVTASGFTQWLKDYIFDQPSRESDGSPEVIRTMAGVFPVFRYQQVDAFFYGGDAVVSIKPIKGLTYSIQGQWIRAKNKKTQSVFPYMPSDKYSHKLEWSQDFYRGAIDNYSVGINHEYVTKQMRFDPMVDFVNVTPDAYHLLGFNASVSFLMPNDNKLTVSLSGDNMLNLMYKEYTNRFRYYAHEKGRDIQFRVRYEF